MYPFTIGMIVESWRTSAVVNNVRYYRWRLMGKKGRMDAKQEQEFWQLVGDNVMNVVDEWYLADKISAPMRYNFLKKLQSTSGLAPDFRARNWQECLKERIIERRVDDPRDAEGKRVMRKVAALPFPDAVTLRTQRRLNLQIKGNGNAKP